MNARVSERAKRAGFSLIEVIMAVAIFASAVVVVLALLPSLARTSADSGDLFKAQGLPDAVRLELGRMARAESFAGLAGSLPVMGTPLDNGRAWVVDRRGGALVPLAGAPAVTADEQYFLVEVWRFPAGPLAYEADGGVLVAHVRVSWPYRVPGATAPTSPEERRTFAFSLAINR